MAELKTVLGFEASGAIATLKQMEGSLLSWTASMKKAGAASSAFNRSGGRIEGTLRKTTAAAGRANTATSSYYKNVAKGSKSATAAVVSGAKSQEEAGQRVLLSWQSVVRIFAIQVIHQAVTKITNALWESVSAARDFEIGLAEIQTISLDLRGDFEGLATAVREFSDATGAPIESVVSGVYQTLSNQVADASEAFEFMTATQAFATATMTNTADSVDLLSSVINSYNKTIDESAKVGAKLAAIIDLGRIRGEEFANTFGRITVLAAQLGITFDEVGASVATLTVTGLKYNEASTLMLNIMLKLIRPTEALKDRYEELGIAGAEAGIQAFGFKGFLDKLSESTGSSATALGKLFGRVRAIRGVMGLANKNADQYAISLEAIKAATSKELFEKRGLIFVTNAKQVEIELNKLRNTIITGFGRAVTDALKTTFDIFGGAVGTIKALAGATLAATVALIALKFEAIAATKVFAVMITAFPVVALVAAIAIVTAAIIAFSNRAQAEAERTQKKLERVAAVELKTRLRNLDLETDAQTKHNNEMLSIIQKHLFGRQKAFVAAGKNLIKLESLIFTSIADQLSNRIGQLNTFFDTLQQRAAAATTVIASLNNAIRLVQFDISDFNFERETRGLKPIQKAFANIERSTKLRKDALAAARKGEFEVAEAYNNRAKDAARSAISSADESGNRKAIAKAVKEVEAASKNEIAILRARKALTIAEQKAIESQADKIDAVRDAATLLKDEMALVAKKFAEVKFDPIKRAEVIAEGVSIAKELDAIFSDIKINFDFAGVEKLSSDMHNLLTGERGPAGEIVEDLVRAVSQEAARIKLPTTEADVAIAAQVPGAKSILEQEAAYVEIGKILKDHLVSRKAITTADAEIKKGLIEQKGLANDLAEAYKATAKVIGTEIKPGTILFGPPVVTPILETSKAEKEAVDLVAEAQRLLNEEKLDAAKFTAVTEALADLASEASDPATITAIGAIIDNLQALAEQKVIATEAQLSILSLEEYQRNVQQLEDITNKLGPGITEGAAVGAAGVQDAGKVIRADLKKSELQAVATAKAIAAAGGGGKAVNARFGTLLYRADGGWAPRGTDTLRAMLSPGEYVMDAKHTRQFYSQLVSMSSGTQPIYRAEGGPVTNIGDISINVTETVSAQQTARETMQAFRRQTRRRASTL